MRTRHLSRLLIVAILILSTAPLYAQGAQPDLAKLKAETQKAVSIISEDKAKTQAFCEIESPFRSSSGLRRRKMRRKLRH